MGTCISSFAAACRAADCEIVAATYRHLRAESSPTTRNLTAQCDSHLPARVIGNASALAGLLLLAT